MIAPEEDNKKPSRLGWVGMFAMRKLPTTNYFVTTFINLVDPQLIVFWNGGEVSHLKSSYGS